MARIGDNVIVAGKKYRVYAVANWKGNAEKDKRILLRHGKKARIVLDKNYKAGYGMFKKRYLILGRD